MAAREMDDVDDFLNDKPQRGGSGGSLDGWKKDGELIFWLHMKRKPIGVWRHALPVVTVKDDDEGEAKRIVFMGTSHPCHEEDDVLKEQFFRNKDGSRQNPPKRCPVDRFAEAVRGLVETRKLDIAAPVIRVTASDPTRTVVLHAGGLYNYGGSKVLREDKKLTEHLKSKGISVKEAFKENIAAKHEYLLCGVAHKNPGAGVQRLFAASSLGERVKDVIAKAREDMGDDEGNPFINPFAFKFIYREKETDLNKKYDAVKLGKLDLPPEIEKLIKSPPPDYSFLTEPLNRAGLRANLERWVLPKVAELLDFDAIFAPYEDGEDPGEPAADAKGKGGKGRKPKAVEPEEEAGEPCSECGAEMAATATVCPKCGAEFEVAAEEPAAKKPEPVPSRKKGSKPKPKAEEPEEPADDDSEIPF